MICFTFFPHVQHNNINNSLEKFVLATQIKITAFQVVTDNKFHTWNQFHFSVKLMQIIKTSIKICDLYCIPISFLHALLDYAQEAAHGALHFFMIDFWNIDLIWYIVIVIITFVPSFCFDDIKYIILSPFPFLIFLSPFLRVSLSPFRLTKIFLIKSFLSLIFFGND